MKTLSKSIQSVFGYIEPFRSFCFKRLTSYMCLKIVFMVAEIMLVRDIQNFLSFKVTSLYSLPGGKAASLCAKK
jgi:hypothetical protein